MIILLTVLLNRKTALSIVFYLKTTKWGVFLSKSLRQFLATRQQYRDYFNANHLKWHVKAARFALHCLSWCHLIDLANCFNIDS